MTKQPRKTRYSSSNCIQDIFGFICNYVLSYSKPDQKYIAEDYIDHLLIDEPQEIISPIVDYVHTHTPVHIPDAPVETLVRHKPPALSPTLAKPLDGCKPLASSPVLAKVPDRYKPLDLPPFSMTSLSITSIICLGLMEKMGRSLLKSIFKTLRISLTFMRLKMMMSVSGCLPCLWEVKLKIGLRTFQLQASEIFSSSCKFS
jgi:hypothetical protein